MNMVEIENAISALGVTLIEANVGHDGAYQHATKTIYICPRLTPIERRCVLAHEYVHAVRGDDGRQDEATEALIDERAALLLISPPEYAAAEIMYGANIFMLARELDVTPTIIEAYQRVLGRGLVREENKTLY